MDKYDISKLDLFCFTEVKDRELCNIHSVLLFLYSKRLDDKNEVSFKYAEISWMDKRLIKKVLELLNSLKIINILTSPKQNSKMQNTPFRIELRTNEEVNRLRNKNISLGFEKYNFVDFSRKDFLEALGCSSVREHFLLVQVGTWIKNINRGVWDLSEFLVLAKIISYFNCEDNIKTYTLQKYMGQKGNFIFNKVRFLYSKVPLNKKDILFTQFQNTLKELKIKNDNSFEDMVKKYIREIKEPSMAP